MEKQTLMIKITAEKFRNGLNANLLRMIRDLDTDSANNDLDTRKFLVRQLRKAGAEKAFMKRLLRKALFELESLLEEVQLQSVNSFVNSSQASFPRVEEEKPSPLDRKVLFRNSPIEITSPPSEEDRFAKLFKKLEEDRNRAHADLIRNMNASRNRTSHSNKAYHHSKIIATMNSNLKIKTILDPSNPDERKKFTPLLAQATKEIRQYCKDYQVPIQLGRKALGKKFSGATQFEYEEIVESKEFLQLEAEDPEDALDRTTQLLWKAYTELLQTYPDRRRDSTDASKLSDYKILLKRHESYDKLRPHIDTANITNPMKTLADFTKFVEVLEASLIPSSSILPTINRSDLATDKVPICRYFNSAKGCYRKNCRYRHVKQDVPRKPADKPEPNNRNNDRAPKSTTKVCFQFWATGTCTGCPGLQHLSPDDVKKLKRTNFCPICCTTKNRRYSYCAKCFRYYNDNVRSNNPPDDVPSPNLDVKHIDNKVVEAKTTSVSDAVVSECESKLSAKDFPDSRLYVQFEQICKKCLLDSGAQVSLCDQDTLEEIKKNCSSYSLQPAHVRFGGIDNSTTFIAKQVLNAELRIILNDGKAIPFYITALISRNTNGLLIGIPDLRLNQCTLDIEKGKLSMRNNRIVRIDKVQTKIKPTFSAIQICKVSPESAPVKFSPHECSTTIDDPMTILVNGKDFGSPAITSPSSPVNTPVFGDISGSSDLYFHKNATMLQRMNELQKSIATGECLLSTEEFHKVRHIVSLYQDRFVVKLPATGKLRDSTYSLKGSLKSEEPILVPPFKLDQRKAVDLERCMRRDVELGYKFHPKASEIRGTLPTFPVYEKSYFQGKGKIRCVIDGRALNKVTYKDPFPQDDCLSSIDDIGQHRHRATFDAKSGFNQCSMDHYTTMRTVLTTQYGLYALHGMPEGLLNALQHFTRVVRSMFPKSIHRNVVVDDVIIHSSTFNGWLETFISTLKTSRNRNLYWKLSKLQIGMSTTCALGHCFRGESKSPDKRRLEGLSKLKIPKSKKQVQMVLGLFNYWREFIPLLQEKNKAIRSVLQSAMGQKISWNDKATKSMMSIKNIISSDAFLHYPQYEQISEAKPFELFTDACSSAVGYVLLQFIGRKKYLVQCGSRAIKRSEESYHISRKEFLGLIHGLDKTKAIVRGRDIRANFDASCIPFLVRNSKVKMSSVWSRYAAYLNTHPLLQYRFCPGVKNVVADPLSRMTESPSKMESSGKTLAELFPKVCQAAKSYILENVTLSKTCVLSGCDKKVLNSSPDPDKPYMFCSKEHADISKKKLRRKIDKNLITGPMPDEDANALLKDFLGSHEALAPAPSTDPIHIAKLSMIPTHSAPSNISTKAYKISCLDVVNIDSGVIHPPLEITFDKQMECKELEDIILSLQDENHRNHAVNRHRYKIEQKILCHIAGDKLQRCVPSSDRKSLMKSYHCSSLAAHRGYQQTLELITRYFYWPRMCRDIKNFVKTCIICLRTKAPVLATPYVTTQGGARFSTWASDFIGPLREYSGYKYILTFRCLATGWIEAFAVTNTSTEVFAKKFYTEIISRYGCPKEFITDLGTTFISASFKYIMKRFGVKLHFSSSGNSRGNAILERSHRDINAAILASLLNAGLEKSADKNWPLQLSSALFAIRNNIPSNSSFSPAMLALGQQLRFPEELHNVQGLGSIDSIQRKTIRAAEKHIQNLLSMQAIANLENEEKRVLANSRRSSAGTLSVGDTVFLHRDHDYDNNKVKDKLSSNWIGPYIIQRKSSGYSDKFILVNVSTGKKSKFIHRRHLRKAHYNTPHFENVPPEVTERKEAVLLEAKENKRPERKRAMPQRLLEFRAH